MPVRLFERSVSIFYSYAETNFQPQIAYFRQINLTFFPRLFIWFSRNLSNYNNFDVKKTIDHPINKLTQYKNNLKQQRGSSNSEVCWTAARHCTDSMPLREFQEKDTTHLVKTRHMLFCDINDDNGVHGQGIPEKALSNLFAVMFRSNIAIHQDKYLENTCLYTFRTSICHFKVFSVLLFYDFGSIRM